MFKGGTNLLVDAHAHIRPCFDSAAFFREAFRRFDSAAEKIHPGPGLHRILLLAECRQEERFARLAQEGLADWPELRFDPTGEPVSFRLQDLGGREIFAVSGRQIVSRERLEVLALGFGGEIPDRAVALPRLVAEVLREGAMAVLPWGFGKWWGKRGKAVRRLIESHRRGLLFVGDNRVRPPISFNSRLFSAAAAKGIWNLPGSDPMPFPKEVSVAGSFGFCLACPFDPQRPFESLKRALSNLQDQPAFYGRRLSMPAFCLYQARLQLRKIGAQLFRRRSQNGGWGRPHLGSRR